MFYSKKVKNIAYGRQGFDFAVTVIIYYYYCILLKKHVSSVAEVVMAITCADLLQLKIFNSIKLVAGKNGLNRQITWPYVCQTNSISDWVHGGELLFITSLEHIADNLDVIVQECITKRLAGLVILLGEERIDKTPANLIEQAEQANLPVFAMPCNVDLIEVKREIIDLIRVERLERKRSKAFLSKLLFSDSLDLAQLADDNILLELNIQDHMFIAVFNVVDNICDNIVVHDNSESSIQEKIHSLCRQHSINIHSLLYGNNIVCLISAATLKYAEKSAHYLHTVHELLSQVNTSIDLYLSLGRIYCCMTEIRKSYQEAKQSLDMCKRIKMTNRIILYSDLGIYRLFLNINNIQELHEFVHYYLGPILEYDEQNRTELLPTLRQYLYCNAHLAKTERALSIHRKTLLHRLNQISDLLSIDLGDAITRLNLFNSIIAKEYLGE